MIHISLITRKPKVITYCRKPTPEEIKFGYGATHYRDFDFEECVKKNGYIKKYIVAKDDKLKYTYC
jgi:hypothetical protein